MSEKTEPDFTDVYATFLRETPPSLLGDVSPTGTHFPTRQAWEEWRARWLPFMLGYTRQPAEPDVWPVWRERMREHGSAGWPLG